MSNNYLQYGEKIVVDPGTCIYRQGEKPEKNPIYYIVAGLIKIEFSMIDSSPFPIYLQPDSTFGIVEPLAECNRLTSAFAMEKTMLYRWDVENFYLASSISWELTYISITGLTRLLRILNAEFGEKIGLLEEKYR